MRSPSHSGRLFRAAIAAALVWLPAGPSRAARATEPAADVSFVQDVVPALTRAGCNQGPCHGAAAGKGGLRLSLNGFAPELDYVAITRQSNGRRVSRTRPEESLLLRKPMLRTAHRGGLALRPGTPEHRVLTTWLAQGAPGPREKEPAVLGLDVRVVSRSVVEPRPGFFRKGEPFRLKVMARLSDGTARDVTYWSRYASNDENVALIRPEGRGRMVGEGETAVTVAYQDRVGIARVAVPYGYTVDAAAYRTLPSAGVVDDLIHRKLVSLNLWPSPPAADAELIRRLMLDLIGTLPTPEEVRAFTADRDPKKREKLVDVLFERPEYVDFWAYRWSDLLRVNRGTLKDKGMWAFHAWVRDAVRENMPWDRMAREVLTATGNTFLDGPANYFRTSQNTEELAENISQGFLGIRVGCAKCHNHPLEKWTQNEYYAMAGLFTRVGRKVNNDPWVNEEMTVYNLPTGELVQPRLGRPVPLRPLGGPEMPASWKGDRRLFFAEWLTSPKNRQFATSIVNRVWAHFMGRGLVEAVDDLRETNPPTNPALLDALVDDFVAHGFDLRHLMRRIVTSKAYQRSSQMDPRNAKDDRHYSRYYVRRLTAEQLLDAVSQVSGVPEEFPAMPAGYRAIQLPDTQVKSEFMDLFGRPARQITCECERTQEPSMAQALLFINSELINKKVTADGGLVDRLIKEGRSDAQLLTELYETTLGRPPRPAERARNAAALRRVLGDKPEAAARRRAFEDLLWVMVNSKEFLFNH